MNRIDPVPLPRRGQAIVAAVTLALVALFVYSIARNPNLDWTTYRSFLFSEHIIRGVLVTLKLATISMAIVLPLGVIVAVMRMSSNRLLRTIGRSYVELFRAVPLIVLILVVGNLALLFPRLSLGLPLTGITIASVDTNTAITGFTAAIIALTLYTGAYMAEIVRGAIQGIDVGQVSAAKALGLTKSQTLRIVVLPQAARIMLPPTGNEFVLVLKYTSLVSVIGGGDLLTVATNLASANYKTMELLFVAATWYFAIVLIASFGQSRLQRRMDRSVVNVHG